MFVKKQGFTLVEVVVALSILAILSLLSVSSFKSSNVNNRLVAENNLLNNVFTYARAEAFRRNSYVSICATTDFATCNATDFSGGTLVYSDPQSTGLTSSSQIIRVYDKWVSNDKGKITTANASNIFTFNGNSNGISNGSVLICQPTYNSYTLTLTQVGGVNTTKNVGDRGC